MCRVVMTLTLFLPLVHARCAGSCDASTYISLLQRSARLVSNRSVADESDVGYGLEDIDGAAIYDSNEGQWLTAADNDMNADVCGERVVTAQLQIQIEVFKKFGLLHSLYARCRVPHAAKTNLMAFARVHGQDLLDEAGHSLPHERLDAQGKRTRLLVVFWAVAAIYMISSFVLGTYATRSIKRPLQLKGRSGKWAPNGIGGIFLRWLDPILSLYSRRSAGSVDDQEVNTMQPDFHILPPAGLRALWGEEVQNKGLQGASLPAVLGKFLGRRTMVQIFLSVAVTMVLELVGMTVVLDVMLNYMRWASDARIKTPFLSMDTLGPSLMVILLAFVFPLAARYFSVLSNLTDGFQSSRIVSGLLAIVYEKSQKLPVGGAQTETRPDVNQLVSDVAKVWSTALKSYAQLAASPICMLVFFGIFANRFGWAAIGGAAACMWLCVFYVPAYHFVRRSHRRWMQLTDMRGRLMKDVVMNIRGVKGMSSDRKLAESVLDVRDKEMDTRLQYSVVTSLMLVPVMLMPFALISSTLMLKASFNSFAKGAITSRDLFVCMQVLSGLVACTTIFSSALQRTLTLPNSVRRVERYLKEPECPEQHSRPSMRHPLAPVAQVSGSFAFAPGQQPVLSDIGLSVQRGECVAIVGDTGSGKSALLASLLGEMPGTDGRAHVDVPARVAYCAQSPWIGDGDLHDNITLGGPLDRERYEAALASASLTTCALGEHTAAALAKSAGGDGEGADGADRPRRTFAYFELWNVFICVVLVLSIVNVDWGRTPLLLGALIVLVQGLLHWSVMEIPLQTMATFFVEEPPKPKRADGSKLTIVLNYNLLAVSKDDVETCIKHQYKGFIGNIAHNVSAVLVSATNDPELKQYELAVRDKYRDRIYAELVHEGLCWAGLEDGEVDAGRRERLWSKYQKFDKQEFTQTHLHSVCRKIANEFMVVHRVSRVLRKCGQYQDLMLLSEGYDTAFTYTDTELYGDKARPFGEPLFHPSADVDRLAGRHFDYTLVLDADTLIVPGSVFELLDIGAGNPDRAILQPAIQMECGPGDSIFMHIEGMRQTINAPLTAALTGILGECGFYGKGLIKNTRYIDKVLGTPEAPLEVVPIDVLSHDTFEAMVLRPMYINDVPLLEAPPGNYVTWDIRERRWNRGELLLAGYFFPKIFGTPIRWLQSLSQGKTFEATKVRTVVHQGPVSEYLAHSALRQILLKPLLVIYIVMMDFVQMHYQWAPFLCVMFLIIIFPKFATCNRDNYKAVALETVASIIQFTPECVVGTIRVLRAFRAHITGNARWVPQSAVEEDFERSNPFISSLQYLWYYPIFAVLTGMLVTALMPESIFIMWMLGTLLTLPFYAGFTAIKTRSEDIPGPPFPYFQLWNVLAVTALFFGAINVNWERTYTSIGVMVVAIQGVLHWSVLEIPLQTLATYFTPPKLKCSKRADASHLTLVLNYHLLATARGDIDECMANMLEAYMGSIAENVSACLVSATNDEELKNYELEVRNLCREKIYNDLVYEGLVWAGFEHGHVDPGRYKRVWSKFRHVDPQEFAQVQLSALCQRFASEFMVCHRVSRVLRKCGQYQDFMLLSSGHSTAFTYCDPELYLEAARRYGEDLFNDSDDVRNCLGRNFDYTLVLDADTAVDKDTVFDMLEIGAANPDRAIIQPSISMDCKPGDSLFIHIESLRQTLCAPLTNALTQILNQSGFYGKGLIKNSVYIEKCIGTPENPVEVVPVDVLSHDTFEAAVVSPLFAGDVYLREAPCGNYVTWDIRERRWNRGEVILAMYFFPETIGKPMRWLQGKLQGKNFKETKVRTVAQLSPISEYVAHSALRQILLKPVLVLYIIMMDFCEMHYPVTPLALCMFLIIVFPKLATCSWNNLNVVLLETTASIIQFTPECVVGTIRILRALKAHLTGNARWVPQRAVEEEFESTNAFLFSFAYLWYYPLFALLTGILVSNLVPDAYFIMWMLGTLFTLPVYAGFTGLRTPKSSPLCIHEVENAAAEKAVSPEAFQKLNAQKDWLQTVAVGPRGAFLSAGERSQVAFARAAYQNNAELVLLDDPLANLDEATGFHLVEQITQGELFKDRARVMTMAPREEYLSRFDRVVVMEGGKVTAQGTPEAVFASSAFRALLNKSDSQEEETPVVRPTALVARVAPASLVRGASLPAEGHGQVHWRTIGEAAMAGGPKKLIAAGVAVVLVRAAVMGAILLLGIWADRKQVDADVDDHPYIQSFAVLIGAAGVLQALQSYWVLSFGSAAASVIFKKAFTGAINSPVGSFWGVQSAGRVLNRLSGDVLTIDSSPSGFLTVATFICSVFVQQAYCLIIMPKWLALPMYVVIALLASSCIGAAGPLQQGSLMSLSRCHEDHVGSAPESVRAYSQESNRLSKHCESVGATVKQHFFAQACAKQWLIFRINVVICFQCTVCMLSGVLRPSGVHIGTLTMIALLTCNIIQELDSFIDAVISSIGVGISVERLTDLLFGGSARGRGGADEAADEEAVRGLPQREALARARTREILGGGGVALELLAVAAGYDNRAADAVVGASVRLPAGASLAVVGPAGSGKTALLMSISHLVAPRAGRVLLGGMDLSDRTQVGDELLRRLVHFMPQEPTIFRGSVRFNIDPSGESSDEQIWQAVRHAQLAPALEALEDGLDHALARSGEGGLSFGERQLLCLARALCSEPALLLMDASLSAVDPRKRAAAMSAVRVALPQSCIAVAMQDNSEAGVFDKVLHLDATY